MAKAKRKPGRPKSASGPKEWFQMRLPKAYWGKLQELKRKTRRAMTVEVQLALEVHLKANGIDPPPV